MSKMQAQAAAVEARVAAKAEEQAMSKVIFVAQTDETRRKEALAQLDEIMVEIRERAAQLLEIMKEDVLTCLSDTHRQLALDLGEVELEDEAKAWPEAKADETDQQLCAELKERLRNERSGVSRLHEADLDTEYELVGRIDGTYAGRWMLAVLAENAAAVWPDGTAVYVRRIKE